MKLYLFCLLSIMSLYPAVCSGNNFGIRAMKQQAAEVGMEGVEVDTPENEITAKELALELVAKNDYVHPQDALEIATLIEVARTDEETIEMLDEMKTDMNSDYQTMVKDLSEKEIVFKLKKQLDEVRIMDYLFKDSHRALKHLTTTGVVDSNKYDLYERNPQILEDDARRAHYITFVKIAAAGGYL